MNWANRASPPYFFMSFCSSVSSYFFSFFCFVLYFTEISICGRTSLTTILSFCRSACLLASASLSSFCRSSSAAVFSPLTSFFHFTESFSEYFLVLFCAGEMLQSCICLLNLAFELKQSGQR